VGTGIPIRAPVAGWGIGPKCRYPGTRLRKANRHRRTPSTTWLIEALIGPPASAACAVTSTQVRVRLGQIDPDPKTIIERGALVGSHGRGSSALEKMVATCSRTSE